MEIIINIKPEELGLTERDMEELAKRGQAKRKRGGWLLLDPLGIEKVKTTLLLELGEEW